MDIQTAIHHNLLQSIIYFIWYFLV